VQIHPYPHDSNCLSTYEHDITVKRHCIPTQITQPITNGPLLLTVVKDIYITYMTFNLDELCIWTFFIITLVHTEFRNKPFDFLQYEMNVT